MLLTDDEDIGFGDSPEDMNQVRRYNDSLLKEIHMDKWDRKTNFNCDSCMYYVPKKDALIGGIVVDTVYGFCRRHAPTIKGFPVAWASDWCGEHKIGSNPVRDAGKSDHAAAPREDYNIHWCEECKKFYPIQFKSCPKCGNNGIPVRDVREPAAEIPAEETEKMRFCEVCQHHWHIEGKVFAVGTKVDAVYIETCPKCVEFGRTIIKQPPDDTGTHNTETLRFCRMCEQYWDTNADVVVMKPDVVFEPISLLFCPKCAASVPPLEIDPTAQEIKDRADAQSRG